jgi:drug/metabolite transporter (DMT)-like permease
MRRIYIVYHWALTLVFAPVIIKCIDYLFDLEPSIIGDLGIYPVTFVFSIVFSLPTLAVYSAWFFFIERHHKSILFVKTSLILIAVLGIIIMFKITNLNLEKSTVVGYCLAAVFTGYWERLKPREETLDLTSNSKDINNSL